MDEIFENVNEDIRLLNEMAFIGEFMPFIAYVYNEAKHSSAYGTEGSVPHFHLIKGNPDSPNWQTCIKIRTVEYFHHTGKEEVLNSGERKEMIDFLIQPNRYISSVSNWQYLVAQWSSNNPKWEIEATTPMPDYLLL